MKKLCLLFIALLPALGWSQVAWNAGTTTSGFFLYNASSTGFSFAHSGLSALNQYFCQAWRVDAFNNYSTALTANAITGNLPVANVVINQLYGGGGNSGAYYKNDFIELYNNENTPVDLTGWSLQYSTATATGTWITSALTGTIPAHSFFLVQEAAGANGTANLPTPDATGNLNLGSTGGKVLLSNSTIAQTGMNPAGATVIDLVGYGPTATGYETSPAPATTNTTSISRVATGADNNNNATDFAITNPTPRNSTYTITPPGISLLTPPNGITGIAATLVPTIVFDKPVVKASGTITVIENDVARTPVNINDASVVISNTNTVTINTTISGENIG